MRTFQGRTRTHALELTIGAAKRIKAALGIDLLRPTSERDGLPLVNAVFTDIELCVDLLYELTQTGRPDALGPAEFADELPDSWQTARDAFFEEWLDFFRRAALEDKAATIAKQLELLRAALAETWDRLEALDMAPIARQQVANFNFLEHLRTTPGTKLTSLPGSSASTPIR